MKDNRMRIIKTGIKQRSKNIGEVIDLIKKIEKIDNLPSENQNKANEDLQILPGNRTGVITSLSLR